MMPKIPRAGHDVYTNDRHLLQAARYFELTGVNVLGDHG